MTTLAKIAEGYQKHDVAVSLLTVCTLALGEAENWSDDVRQNATQDIRHTLEYAIFLLCEAERLQAR